MVGDYLGALAAMPVAMALDDVVQKEEELQIDMPEPKNGMSRDFFASLKMCIVECIQSYLVTHSDSKREDAIDYMKQKIKFVFPSIECCGYKFFQQEELDKVVGYQLVHQ